MIGGAGARGGGTARGAAAQQDPGAGVAPAPADRREPSPLRGRMPTRRRPQLPGGYFSPSHTRPYFGRVCALNKLHAQLLLQLCGGVSLKGVLLRVQAQAERVAALESELRRSKRREEKLTALQFRLREDLKECGGDPR